MKKQLPKAILMCLFAAAFHRVSAQELQFSYDAAGNQTERRFICFNCSTFPYALSSAPTTADATTSVTNPNNSTIPANRKFIAYPNPLTQIMNLRWGTDFNYYINRIEVYSSKGINIFKRDYQFNELFDHYETIPFNKQVPGFYFIKAQYSDGKQAIVKVVKIDK